MKIGVGKARRKSAALVNPKENLSYTGSVPLLPDAQIFDLSLVAKRPPTGTQMPEGRRALLASLQISANLF